MAAGGGMGGSNGYSSVGGKGQPFSPGSAQVGGGKGQPFSLGIPQVGGGYGQPFSPGIPQMGGGKGQPFSPGSTQGPMGQPQYTMQSPYMQTQPVTQPQMMGQVPMGIPQTLPSNIGQQSTAVDRAAAMADYQNQLTKPRQVRPEDPRMQAMRNIQQIPRRFR